MTRHTKELLGTAVGCLGSYGLLLSLGLGHISIARFLLGIGIFVAFLVVALDAWRGALVRSVLLVPIVCLLAFGLGYAPNWYLSRAYADRPLFSGL